MGLSERNKRKHIAKAMSMVPPDGARPLDYAVGGGGNVPPSLLRWGLLGGWVGITAVVSLALQTLIVVGGLPMLAIYFAMNKPRGVLLTDRGLASLRCGFFNGRPTGLLGLGPLATLDQRLEQRASSTKLQIGEDQAWIADKDLARFLDAAPPPGPSGPPTAAPGVF